MEFLQELFLTLCMAVLFSMIFFMSIAVSGGEEKVVSGKGRVEEVKLDKGLRVVGAKSMKRVRFVDEVVVRDVHQYDVAEEPCKYLNLVEDFGGVWEGEILGEERAEVEIMKVFDEFESEGVCEELRGMVAGGEVVEEFGEMVMEKEVKNGVVEEKECEGVGLVFDMALEKGVEEDKSGDQKVGESDGLEVNAPGDRGLKILAGVDEMKNVVIDSKIDLNIVDDNGSIDHEGAKVGEYEGNGPTLLGEALEKGDGEERTEEVEMNSDAICRGEEAKTAVGSTLENLFIEQNFSCQGLGGQSEVEMVKDDVAFHENENSDVINAGVNDSVGIKEDLSKMSMVEEEAVRDEVEEVVSHNDDDWEGIESSELERVFAEAVNYVEYGGKGKDDLLTNLGSDVQLQLYGLHKLAVEGPCHEPQPMALKVSARAKWNAWQRLGSMSPELAMEQYIELLSEADPDWTYHPAADASKDGFIKNGAVGDPNTNVNLLKSFQTDTGEGGRSQDRE